eukprot:scaffold1134_cov143-Isochrysis_galbana.AAC.3
MPRLCAYRPVPVRMSMYSSLPTPLALGLAPSAWTTASESSPSPAIRAISSACVPRASRSSCWQASCSRAFVTRRGREYGPFTPVVPVAKYSGVAPYGVTAAYTCARLAAFRRSRLRGCPRLAHARPLLPAW